MSGKRSPTLQEVVTALQAYWAEQGCVIWQPYYTQVGAGTMNPATYLRVLGPEPWRVAYVEPSIRPADARYGENPNRMGTHYQFQVILKPDPGDPQERYLNSLQALGIDLQQHDVRFVEDNWEAPALGAWGLGWEVWLDGQEITQFTYFQQAGGLPLEPVSVEITYGLERILMALQGAQHFREIQWNQAYTYGDLLLQAEREQSRYYFEVGDVERLRTMFGEFYEEAKACLAQGLVLPAYDYVLKCSHTFNLLDSRAAIGVTERATLFGRMREVARAVAQAFVSQREQLGHPWLSAQSSTAASPEPEHRIGTDPAEPAPFVLEVGVEELPPRDLQAALTQLSGGLEQLLAEHRLDHEGVRVLGTPRRLAAMVDGLSPRQRDQTTIRRGPPVAQAFDAAGKPTPAASGFAKSSGVALDQLTTQEVDGGEYLVAEVREQGSAAWEVLQEALPELLAGIRFDRPMRWTAAAGAFSRPIRWLLALHGGYEVPFTFAGIRSGVTTRGLRLHDPEAWAVKDADDYLRSLAAGGILLSVKDRRDVIWEHGQRLAAEVDGQLPEDPELLAEVTHLVEAPSVFRGEFDPDYLALPYEVLVSVMKVHQRYFPIQKQGTLLPYFIGVANGQFDQLTQVIAGNEHVIRARFADAAYFVQRDQELPLEAYRERLESLIFQADLGSMLGKLTRIEGLVSRLADQFHLSEDDRATAARAAHLCKADLATQMVIEMTSLQGAMGRYYALASGETEQVAEAIFEHHLPRAAGDQTPRTRPGQVVGLADRLDTLMGLFAIGMKPSGTSDPYGLRRAAIGLIQILIESEHRFDLRRGLRWASEGLPVPSPEAALQECMQFIADRQQILLKAEDLRHDVVEAVLAEQAHDPAGAAAAVRDLQRWVLREDWPETLQAYARCARIVRSEQEEFPVDPQAFQETASKALYRALEKCERSQRAPGSVDDFLEAFQPLIKPIQRFFDEVLVMADETSLRRLRLGLLQRIVRLSQGVADLSRLEGF